VPPAPSPVRAGAGAGGTSHPASPSSDQGNGKIAETLGVAGLPGGALKPGGETLSGPPGMPRKQRRALLHKLRKLARKRGQSAQRGAA
jgi:hypothetical protein